ncbi:MAG: ribosome-associated translation inhibitor RaiA [Syntrophales bacterium]|nr:ribosome-associated translation inhibitor RaiA [Syntrophales bacterium]
MKISVTFRNTEGEEWHKQYVEERLQKLKKYLDHPVEAHVVLSVEKFRNVAEINLSNNGLNVNAKEEAKEMQQAIDNAVEKIERQLKKHREKIRVHKGNSSKDGDLSGPTTEEIEDPAEGKIAETRRIILKPMAIEDAILELETTKYRFLLFRDLVTESVCVIYRRDDDRYALIETNK